MKIKYKLVLLLCALVLFLGLLSFRVIKQLNTDTPSPPSEEQNTDEIPRQEDGSYHNVWITGLSEEDLTLTALCPIDGGAEFKTFSIYNTFEIPEGGILADLTAEQDTIHKIVLKPDTIKDKVLTITDSYIELEHYGKLKLDSNFAVYDLTDDTVGKLNPIQIPIGSETEFVAGNNELQAALLREKYIPETIRVLLKTTGFTGIVHKEIKVKANCPVTLNYGDDKKKSYKKGKTITIKPGSKYLSDGRLSLVPEGSGTISVLSHDRNGIPAYQGTLEIALTDDEKGLYLINELSLEDYLAAVLPSEMPSSYGLEALKAQAVCARSYALMHLGGTDLAAYGAHVDDSTSYQVYNNQGSDKLAIQAVNETAGQVLTYDGSVVPAYYYATSCGHGASCDEVWFNGNNDYLTGRLLCEDEDTSCEILSDDKKFAEFLSDDTLETYDSEFPWYRWQAEVSYKDIQKNLENSLASRYKASPSLIQVQTSRGKYESKPVSSIGTVKKVEVVKRQDSGIVTMIEITGSKETIRVASEYNIRTFLAPGSEPIIRKDKSKVSTLTLLPSAFITIENEKKGVKIEGGGYGHGVGMSQTGAKTMASQGKTYDEILGFFYEGSQIQTVRK
ncbi:SpoIID/LytB domain-containing protein [Anaerolentibacter hominis]|uniref:SpoIID/LytB domain-containing protein n=1 Tax=Anaerolentibacter hominis TaxID=3079009 RepID=UPI0031B8A65D